MNSRKKSLTLAIIIPAYNEENYLKECLELIARQTTMPDEVIVVDNNSSDKTPDIAMSYNFVTLVHEKRQGSSYASLTGMNKASSSIIGRIDADTRLPKDWCEKLIGLFSQNPDVAAYTGKCTFYGLPFPAFVHNIHELFFYKIQSWATKSVILWGSNMAIRSNVWHEIKDMCSLSYDAHEDIDISLILHKKSLKIVRLMDLLASVAIRRPNNIGHYATYKYLAGWPKTYYSHGLIIQGIIMHVMMVIAYVMSLPYTYIYKLWLRSHLASKYKQPAKTIKKNHALISNS